MTFSTFGTALARWAEYRRTRAALERLPLDTALDLDIYPRDAARIARRAVYGA
ncbi:MAG: DUF1127 domain-containing protein [Rhodobacteraceae bacterium]|nr:DUF1127 domain-containing protein [Paracoccaceae bacterium]